MSSIVLNDTIKSWLFVGAQAMLLVLTIFLPNSGSDQYRILKSIGGVLEIIGLAILAVSIYDLRQSLTVLPLPVRSGELQVSGMYKYMRHPMYTAVLILSLGIAIGSNNYIKYILFIALVVLFSFKARYEEQLLSAQYPGYKKYMLKTPRFLPRVVRKNRNVH